MCVMGVRDAYCFPCHAITCACSHIRTAVTYNQLIRKPKPRGRHPLFNTHSNIHKPLTTHTFATTPTPTNSQFHPVPQYIAVFAAEVTANRTTAAIRARGWSLSRDAPVPGQAVRIAWSTPRAHLKKFWAQPHIVQSPLCSVVQRLVTCTVQPLGDLRGPNQATED
jgi:hypothetical protein